VSARKRKGKSRPALEQEARNDYVALVGLVYRALAAEQDIGLFGTARKGRDLPPVKLGKVVLKRATKSKSMEVGHSFATIINLAREAGMERRAACAHLKTLRERSQCFVFESGQQFHAPNRIWPALDGVPIHPNYAATHLGAPLPPAAPVRAVKPAEGFPTPKSARMDAGEFGGDWRRWFDAVGLAEVAELPGWSVASEKRIMGFTGLVQQQFESTGKSVDAASLKRFWAQTDRLR
jgi:hypothetical protein